MIALRPTGHPSLLGYGGLSWKPFGHRVHAWILASIQTMAIRVIQEWVVKQGGLGAFITYGIGSTIQSLIDAGESSSGDPEIVVEVPFFMTVHVTGHRRPLACLRPGDTDPDVALRVQNGSWDLSLPQSKIWKCHCFLFTLIPNEVEPDL